MYNTHTKRIAGIVERDVRVSEATLEPEVASRWMSPDPLAAKMPYASPYNYALNNPVLLVDPDGQYPILGRLAQLFQRAQPALQRASNTASQWAQRGGQAVASGLSATHRAIYNNGRSVEWVRRTQDWIASNIQNNPSAASEVGNAVYGAVTDDPNEPFPTASGISSDIGRSANKLWSGFKDTEGFIQTTEKGIEGAIKHSDDVTLIFDAAKETSEDGKTMILKGLGVYTAENFGDISNQGAVGVKNIFKYMNDIGKWAKEQGFEKLEISFRRQRPDGSPLPDSENRVIPVDLSKIK